MQVIYALPCWGKQTKTTRSLKYHAMKRRKENEHQEIKQTSARSKFYVCPGQAVLWNLFSVRFLNFLQSSTQGLVCKYLMVSKVDERSLTANWAARELPGVWLQRGALLPMWTRKDKHPKIGGCYRLILFKIFIARLSTEVSVWAYKFHEAKMFEKHKYMWIV